MPSHHLLCQGAVANTLNVFRQGAAGFIDWLGAFGAIIIRGDAISRANCFGHQGNGSSRLNVLIAPQYIVRIVLSLDLGQALIVRCVCCPDELIARFTQLVDVYPMRKGL